MATPRQLFIGHCSSQTKKNSHLRMATTPQRPHQIIPQSPTVVHNGDMKHGISLKIKLIQGLTMNNVYTKFEKDPKRIVDVKVLTL